MHEFKPDLVLHLAAQPLVRRSYLEPKSTFETNTIGTANVLEAALNVPSVKGVLCITTDKVYKNSGLQKKYVEDDELGGLDPYSSSKAAAEFIISSYRLVLRTKGKATPLLAVARGGNIIGGGDWSEDRLIPDFIRSYNQGNSMKIRNPDAVRPWQHVVSLVAGYLNILSGMLGPEPNAFSKAFNLGPTESSSASVTQVLSAISQKLPGVKIEFTEEELHEDKYLEIDSTLAQRTFDWKPGWNQEAAIAKTAEWYMSFLSGKSDAKELCLRQIELWEKDIEELNT
jgi:CDP-glucose 4,6-dehydratase